MIIYIHIYIYIYIYVYLFFSIHNTCLGGWSLNRPQLFPTRKDPHPGHISWAKESPRVVGTLQDK
jgi:hypothetical protein